MFCLQLVTDFRSPSWSRKSLNSFLLFFQGADIGHVDNEGMCALHWAALRGHLDAVQLLLLKGANVNRVARRNNEALLTPLGKLQHPLLTKFLGVCTSKQGF